MKKKEKQKKAGHKKNDIPDFNQEDTEKKIKLNKEKAIFDPASVFKHPLEIVTVEESILSLKEKIQALKSWELDIRLNDIALDENMPAFYRKRDHVVSLQDVHLAREKLGDFTDEHSSTSKLGM